MLHIIPYIEFIVESASPRISDFKVGQVVRYKTKDFDPTKPEKEQAKEIQQKPIARINLADSKLVFKSKTGEEFQKELVDILPEEKADLATVVTKVKKHLGKMKNDVSKMTKVLRYVEFIDMPEN